MQLKVFKSISLTSKLVISIASVVFATTYFFAYTASGISWMLNNNINDPTATISIENVSKEIGGKTVVSNLKYHSETADITFEKITLQWNPLSIFSNQLTIHSLIGFNLSVNIKTNSQNDSSLSVDFPIATKVQSAVITNLKILNNDTPLYFVKQTTIDNIYLERDFFVEKIKLKTEDNRWIAFSGRFGFSTNSVINLTTEANFSLPGKFQTLRVQGTVVGNVAQLRFLQHVDAPVAAEVDGRVKHLFSHPVWEFNTRLKDTNIVSNIHHFSLQDLSGNITFAGDLNNFKLNSDLTFQDRDVRHWHAKLKATAIESDLGFVVNVINKDAKNNSYINLTGSYSLNALTEGTYPTQGLKFNGNWQNIKLSLIDNNTIAAKSGDIEFDGTKLSSKLTANDIQLEKLGPTIDKLVINTRNIGHGKLSFSGNASTSSGNLKLTGKMIKHSEKYTLDALFLSGKNFPLVRKPQAHIIISPEVSFIRKDHTLTSTGTVKIPTANIQLQDFRQTLAQITSFITSDKSQLASSGSVDVEFGKSVWLHGYGLNAHVTGGLSLQELSKEHITANGELKVLRGNYQSLSSNHQLLGGLLKFKNTNIDDPELDLNIVQRKSIENEKEKIVGRLQKLFSDTKRGADQESLKTIIKTSVLREAVAFNSLQ